MEQRVLIDVAAWAGCHYPVYRTECARRFPQNGRGAPTWLRLRGANGSHLMIGTKYLIHSFAACVCLEQLRVATRSQQTVLLQRFLLTAECI